MEEEGGDSILYSSVNTSNSMVYNVFSTQYIYTAIRMNSAETQQRVMSGILHTIYLYCYTYEQC